MSQITTSASGVMPPPGTVVLEFTPDSGTSPVVPDGSGNVNMVGGNNIATVGSLNTITFNLDGTTNHAVQVGNASGSLTSLGIGTTGQVLTGVTGLDPVWASPAASSISITGNSGGALVGSAFTFTGGTTGLTFSGAGTTETLTGTLVVANGGTGVSSFTAYAPIVGGTTTTNPLQSASTGLATSGFILTSNGNAAIPSFQAPAASSISITGNSGGALVGAAFTFTGGTTGLTFSGAGSTETLVGTLVVANGGTGAVSLTDHGVLVGSGTSPIDALVVGTNGQVLLGSTGADPVFATLTSTGGTITYTTGAGTLNLEASASVPTSFVTDAGTTTPALNSLNILGGNNIGTVGSGSTVTINLNDTTNHAVQVGNASGSLTSLGIGTTGQVLTGVTGADPVWASPAASSISITGDSGGALVGAAFTFTGGTTGLTFSGAGSTETLTGTLVVANGGTGATSLTGVLTGNGTSAVTANAVTQFGTVIAGASNAVSSVAPSATSGVPFISQGAAANPVFGTAVVAGGGTGAVSFTAYAPIVGGTTTTNPLQSASTGLATSGFILTSNGNAAIPSFQAPAASSISITGNSGGALTGAAFTFTGGTTGLTFSGSGSTETLTGTLIVANGGTGVATMTTAYAPVCAGTTATGALQVASTGLSTAGFVLTSTGASSLPTWQAAASGGLTWSVVTGATQAVAVNKGYFANNSGTLAFTLPSTAAVGDTFQIAQMHATGSWTLAENSGQTIYIADTNTTITSGTLASTAKGDAIECVCRVANTDFQCFIKSGNITVA